MAMEFPKSDADKCDSLMAKADLMGQDGHGVFHTQHYAMRLSP